MSDPEADRREKLAELLEEDGETGLWENFGSGSFGRHELLHTAHLMTNLAERELLDHPACVRDPSLYAAADRIVAALADFYQAAGRGD